MGSRFDITVPIREHEIELRKREQNIVVNKELGNVGFAGRKTLSSVESDVDIYKGTAERGKKINILVTQNTFEIQERGESSAGPVLSGKDVAMKKNDLQKEWRQNAINRTFLEKHLEESLKQFELCYATWASSIGGNFAQISFTVNAESSEKILNHMLSLGIGLKYDSTFSVFTTAIHYNGKLLDKKKEERGLEVDGVQNYESKLSVSSTSARNNGKPEDKRKDGALDPSGVVEKTTVDIPKRHSTNSDARPLTLIQSSENIREVEPNTSQNQEEALMPMREDSGKKHGGLNNQQSVVFNEISNAEDSTELRIKSAQDDMYNLITRRNVTENGVDILENADGMDSIASHGIENGGKESGGSSRESSMHPKAHHHHPASPGFFGNVFGARFGPPGNVESETVAEVGTPSDSTPRLVSAKPSATSRKR